MCAAQLVPRLKKKAPNAIKSGLCLTRMEASEHGSQCFLLSPHTTYCPLYYIVVDTIVIFNHSFSLAHKEFVAVLEIRKGQTGMPVLLNKRDSLSGWHRDGRAGVRMSPDLI